MLQSLLGSLFLALRTTLALMCSCVHSQELCAQTMTMEGAYQVKITLQSCACPMLILIHWPSSDFTVPHTWYFARHTLGLMCIMTENGRVRRTGHEIVGGTISWSWNGTECQIWKSMGQSWYEWYKSNYLPHLCSQVNRTNLQGASRLKKDSLAAIAVLLDQEENETDIRPLDSPPSVVIANQRTTL